MEQKKLEFRFYLNYSKQHEEIKKELHTRLDSLRLAVEYHIFQDRSIWTPEMLYNGEKTLGWYYIRKELFNILSKLLVVKK